MLSGRCKACHFSSLMKYFSFYIFLGSLVWWNIFIFGEFIFEDYAFPNQVLLCGKQFLNDSEWLAISFIMLTACYKLGFMSCFLMNKNTASDEMTILRLGYKMFVVFLRLETKGRRLLWVGIWRSSPRRNRWLKRKKKQNMPVGIWCLLTAIWVSIENDQSLSWVLGLLEP